MVQFEICCCPLFRTVSSIFLADRLSPFPLPLLTFALSQRPRTTVIPSPFLPGYIAMITHNYRRLDKKWLSYAPQCLLILLSVRAIWADAHPPGAWRMSVDDPMPILENTPPFDDVDYCALASEASKAGHGIIPYSLAKGCYEMFPFDSRIRDNTLQSVHANLESFYVFYDIAKYVLLLFSLPLRIML